MQIQTLNEILFFKNKINKSLKFQFNDGIITINIGDDRFKNDVIKITKLTRRDGYPHLVGQFRIFLKVRGHKLKIVEKTFDNAVAKLLATLDDLRIKAKLGKIETAPADIPFFNKSDFDDIKNKLVK
jgi:hypothetical protein